MHKHIVLAVLVLSGCATPLGKGGKDALNAALESSSSQPAPMVAPPAAVQQAVMVDGIDGGTVLEPSLSAVLTRNPNLRVIASEAGMFPDAQGVGVAVSGKLARENPKAVETLLRLIVHATNDVQKNPQGAAGQDL